MSFGCGFLVVLIAKSFCLAQQVEDNPTANEAVVAKFESRDSDGDDQLSLGEFVAGGGRQPEVLERDFQVLDLDGDESMSLNEFLNVPYLVPREHRGRLPIDPIVELVNEQLVEIERDWSEWDGDSDGTLSRDEFGDAERLRLIRGVEGSPFAEWDRDDDGQVSRDEVRLMLEIGFGVRRPEGELLRTESGFVFDWRTFRAWDRDDDGLVSKERYVSARSAMGQDRATEQFQQIDANQDDRASFEELAILPDLWRDQLNIFLLLDSNLNGRIDKEELVNARLAPGHKRFAPGSLPGFDGDGDGELSLREFRLAPVANVLAIWDQAIDVDNDGKLSPNEFRFTDGPALGALTASYFSHLDQNDDNLLELDEWPFSTKHPKAAFAARDTDGNRQLTVEEYVAEEGRNAESLTRDFHVFDLNSDRALSLGEFLNIPYLVPWEHRGDIDDPIVALVEERMQEFDGEWSRWDTGGSGTLTRDEFAAAAINRAVPGLEMTGFSDWDRDGDGEVSPGDARLLLEIAYGVRRPEGEFVRTSFGGVIDWRTFKALDKDNNGAIEKQDYLSSGAARGVKDPEAFFRTLDTNGNGRASFAEWAAIHRFWANGPERFLQMDTNLDGKLNPDELLAARLPSGQKPMTPHLLPAFDEDEDGSLSLREYQLTPLANLLAIWIAASDMDHDGRLRPAEFRFGDGPSLAALSQTYFARLDVNDDGYLELGEWPFQIDVAKAPPDVVFKQRDTDADGLLSFDEVLGNIPRPEPGKRFDVRHETRLVRMEEAFRRADSNGDQMLDLDEFDSDAGLEAIRPGASGIANRVSRNRGLSETLGLSDADGHTYMILVFNALLLTSVVVYLVVKAKRA